MSDNNPKKKIDKKINLLIIDISWKKKVIANIINIPPVIGTLIY